MTICWHYNKGHLHTVGLRIPVDRIRENGRYLEIYKGQVLIARIDKYEHMVRYPDWLYDWDYVGERAKRQRRELCGNKTLEEFA